MDPGRASSLRKKSTPTLDRFVASLKRTNPSRRSGCEIPRYCVVCWLFQGSA